MDHKESDLRISLYFWIFIFESLHYKHFSLLSAFFYPEFLVQHLESPGPKDLRAFGDIKQEWYTWFDFTILLLTSQLQLQNSCWIDWVAVWFVFRFSEFVSLTSTELLFYCFLQQCSLVNHNFCSYGNHIHLRSVTATLSASRKRREK